MITGARTEEEVLARRAEREAQKQREIERLKARGEYISPETIANIPKPNLQVDPEYRPENLPPQEPYYWEGQPEEVAQKEAELPWWSKALQNIQYYGEIALDKGEMVGEVIANVLGLTESRYQYVIDSLEYEESERQRLEAEEREREELEI